MEIVQEHVYSGAVFRYWLYSEATFAVAVRTFSR